MKQQNIHVTLKTTAGDVVLFGGRPRWSFSGRLRR